MQSLTTEAIILAQWPAREKDRWVRFVSPHLGLTEGRVISGLLTKSKLAPHLLTYSLARLTVISGRTSRRIIGARVLPYKFKREHLAIYALWCLVLERLSPRQPRDEKLFEILRDLYKELEDDEINAKNVALNGLAQLFVYFGYLPVENASIKNTDLTWAEDNLFAIIERPLPAWEYFKKSVGFFN